MAQDLLQISQEAFQLQLFKMSNGALKSLCAEIYTYIGRNADKLVNDNPMSESMQVIYDLERKQTKIWKELQRRGILNDNTNEEFFKWLYSKREKKYC